MDSSSLSYTKWKCQYHIVFIPKYRRKVLYGKIKADVREIIKKLCKYKNVEIVEGAVCVDHVHLCVSIPPKLRIYGVFERERCVYVATVGNITEEAIKRYIQDQQEKVKKEEKN